MKLLFFGTPASKGHNIDRLAIQVATCLNQRADVRADMLDLHSVEMPGARIRAGNIRAGGTAVAFLGIPDRPIRNLPHALARVLATAWKLQTILRAGQYDCIETDSSNHVASLAAALASLPLSTCHIMGVHCDFADRMWLTRRVRNALALRCIGWHTQFYGVSKVVVRSWPRASGTPANRTHLVYNAIHDDFFSARPDRLRLREELGVSADARLVIFVGRLIRDKGIGDLLAAAASVLPTRDAHLLLIGETPDSEFLREVRGRLAIESWGHKVQFLGPRDDIPRLMMSSDVLVLPALWEGFGLVLAEAMACGLPIIATNIGGIPEVLAGTHELIVPTGQPDALRHAVESVLDRHPEDAAVFAAEARASSARFTVDRRTTELYKLFTDLISSEHRCLTLSFPKAEEPDHPSGGV